MPSYWATTIAGVGGTPETESSYANTWHEPSTVGTVNDRRRFGCDDEGGVDPPLLQFLGSLEAAKRHEVIAGRNVVGAEQLLGQLTHS